MESDKIKPNHFDTLPVGIEDGDAKVAGLSTVRVGPKKYTLLANYKRSGLDVYNFEARADDIYLLGFPRSGTTLHCEMIWQIANDLDFDKAAQQVLGYRFPHIDYSLLPSNLRDESIVNLAKKLSDNVQNVVNQFNEISLQFINEMKTRRFIKAHLPISLMPPHVFECGAKIIYAARNPKDVIVSMYHVMAFFNRRTNEQTFEQVFKLFKEHLFLFSPYFEHVKEAWEKRNDENFLFLFYEDTIKDKRQTIRKIANFLNKNLSESQIKILEDYLDIEKFRKNKSVNQNHRVELGMASTETQLIGKGEIGGWKKYFVGDLEREVDEWIQKNLEGTDLRFPDY